MSTPSPTNYPKGSNGNSVGKTSNSSPSQKLRRNSAYSDEEPYSVASGSRGSLIDEHMNESSQLQDSFSNGSSNRSTPDNRANEISTWRNRKRSSGGFLLDPVAQRSRFSGGLISRSQNDAKGKRRSNEADISLPKRRLRNNTGVTGLAVGSSPLATELKHDSEENGEAEHDAVVAGTDVRHSLSSKRVRAPNHGRQQLSTSLQGAESSNIGHETDPAQIVNMALTLSEVRRRQASGKRFVSGEVGTKRHLSSASPGQPGNRLFSTNSPQSLTSWQTPFQNGFYKAGSPILDAGFIDEQHLEAYADDRNSEDDASALWQDTYLSAGTRARVERAQQFFDLAYEHRRLLSHLPPIRRPGLSSKEPVSTGDGKIYNPLQYARNRKLRIWDKTRINAEAEGWHDVEKVRRWVDAVISGNPGTRHDPDECLRLPPLSKPSSEIGESDSEIANLNPDSIKQLRTTDPGAVKPRLPRADWIFHPGNLIADAFWLEQGLNKTKIQDRNNDQIYPPNTYFKFSGWRNRTPLDIPTTLQEPIPPLESQHDAGADVVPSAIPELPNFKSARGKQDSEKGPRKRTLVRDSTSFGDQNRSRRRARRLFRDDSDSDLSDSSDLLVTENVDRGRKLISRKRQKKPPMKNESASPRTRADNSSRVFPPEQNSQPSSAANSKRSSLDHSRFGTIFKREIIKGGPALNRSRTRGTSSREGSIRPHLRTDAEQPRSSMEYDSTAPSSPMATEWPSIAISLSPPPSRSASPTKKSLASKFNPHRDRSHLTHAENVDATDFGGELSRNATRKTEFDSEKHTDSSATVSRGTSPMTRGTSPFSKTRSHSTPHEPQPRHMEHRDSTVSRISTKSATTTGTDHSRIRGIFKGGRIAEIVGNEVSRVGDFILKRDLPANNRHRVSTSDGSQHSLRDSDTEEGHHQNGTIYKTPPHNRVSRSSTVSSTKSETTSPTFSHSSPGSGDHPRYNHLNLPSFTSPFQRDREQQEQKQTLPPSRDSLEQTRDGDHISLLAAQHRTASRSPRLDRLAPPRIDTSGPGTPTGLTHVKSYGFGSTLDLTRSRDASDKLNSALGQAGGVAGIKGSRSAVELSKSYRIGEKGSPQPQADEPTLMRREIDRAHALILTTTVKARELGRRADTPRARMPKFLLDSLTPANRTLHQSTPLRVSRREEHIVAAKNIMSALRSHASDFNEKLNQFNGRVIPNLHSDLQTLEDMVDNNLSPRVRATADEAGEISMKLATTSTLAIKGLNDTIETAIRQRRRGPIRWVRRLWFASIEWTVVGLLWAIWAVVTVIRLALTIFKGVITTGKWLLWLV